MDQGLGVAKLPYEIESRIVKPRLVKGMDADMGC
jgi:hypothetical protein